MQHCEMIPDTTIIKWRKTNRFCNTYVECLAPVPSLPCLRRIVDLFDRRTAPMSVSQNLKWKNERERKEPQVKAIHFHTTICHRHKVPFKNIKFSNVSYFHMVYNGWNVENVKSGSNATRWNEFLEIEIKIRLHLPMENVCVCVFPLFFGVKASK